MSGFMTPLIVGLAGRAYGATGTIWDWCSIRMKPSSARPACCGRLEPAGDGAAVSQSLLVGAILARLEVLVHQPLFARETSAKRAR